MTGTNAMMIDTQPTTTASNKVVSVSNATGTTTTLPRCVCSWKNCRSYQKAFHETNHPILDGVIRIKLIQDQPESIAYKACLDAVLGVTKEVEWKMSKKGAYCCKYTVARHHFTEQHLQKYDENKKSYSFVKPFPLHYAKKYLYTLNANYKFHAVHNPNDVLYLQSPNVPSEIVKVEYFKCKGPRNSNPLVTLSKTSTTKSKKGEVKVSVKDDTMNARYTSRKKISPFTSATADTRDSTSTRSTTNYPIDNNNSRHPRRSIAINMDDDDDDDDDEEEDDEATTARTVEASLNHLEALVEKDTENKLLKNELDEMKRQLSFLHSVVEKLQAQQQNDGNSNTSSKKSRTSGTSSKKKHRLTSIVASAVDEAESLSSSIPSSNRESINKNKKGTGILLPTKKMLSTLPDPKNDTVQLRQQYQQRYLYQPQGMSPAQLPTSPSGQHFVRPTVAVPNEINIDSNDNDVVTMISQLDFSEDGRTFSTNGTGQSSILSRQHIPGASVVSRLLPVPSKLPDEFNDSLTSMLRDDDDDENDQTDCGDYSEYGYVSSACSSTIVSASQSIKSLPRELELQQDEDGSETHESLEEEAFDSRSTTSSHHSMSGTLISSSRDGRPKKILGSETMMDITCQRPAVMPSSKNTTFMDIAESDNVARPVRRPNSKPTPGSSMASTSSTVGDEPVVQVYKFRITDPYGEKGTYDGTISTQTSMPHGKGRLVYDEAGRWYEGDWVHGRWTGFGRVANGDGDLYEGALLHDNKHGHGIMKFCDGRSFEGRYFNGQMVQGKMTYLDGSIYDGTWSEGMRHGFGRCVFVDKSVYEGEFLDGEFNGRGKMTWNDGGWYEGEWLNGEMHGHGCEMRADNTLRHDGEWHKGQPVRSKK